MARYVLFAKSLFFDAEQQVFYPLNASTQRVALSTLQCAVLRRVLNAQGKLVRNQALHVLFQREPSDVPFADRLTTTIDEINRLALHAHAPGALIHQVPLIGCVLAEQVDVEPYNDIVSVDSEAKMSVIVQPATRMKTVVAKRKSWLLRGVLVIFLLLNVALALVTRHELAPTGHAGTNYISYGHEAQTQVFIAESLMPNSFAVQDALRRFRDLKPHLPDGSTPPLLYINRARTRIFTSAFLCARPMSQKNNECMSWMVSAQEIPDA